MATPYSDPTNATPTTPVASPSSIDPTAPAKKQPAALPLAPATPGAAPSAPSATSAKAAPAPAQTPAATALSSATQNTTDPLAFAPPTGAQGAQGAPPGSLTPDAPPAPVAPAASPAASPPSGFVPTGNLSYDSSTGIVQDSGTSLPLDQYLQAMVASGRAHNVDEARLQALGSASTGITYAGTGATQYAPGRGPTPTTPTPVPAATDPASIATHQWQAPTGNAPDTNPSVLPSNIAQAVLQPPAPSGGASGGASGGVGGPAASGGSSASGAAPISTTGPNAGVQLTPTDPNNALTAQTISPNNSVDRVKLAQDSLQSTIDNVLNPQFEANIRDANRYAFGAGRGVSGMERTSLGNVVSDFGHQKADLTNQLLTGATTGSIDDLYRNVGISQQQQGFQADQQKTAFQQAAQAQGLSDAETSQAFQQALQMFYAGQLDDPSLFLEYLSGQYARPVGATA